MLNEYDARQLNIMMAKINAYQNGKLHIHDLIYDLEGLLNALTDIDENWKEEFKSFWQDLEVCYAVALDEEKECFSEVDKATIYNAINHLTKMISMKRSKMLSEKDDPSTFQSGSFH